MLSGAKLLTYRKRYNSTDFLKKRIVKIAIPWIAWCLIWLGYRVLLVKSIQITSMYDLIANLYNGIFLNELQATYWFFIPIIMVYFSMPILSLLIENRRILWYLAGMTFLTYSLLPALCGIFRISYNPALNFPMGAGYLLFVVLGYLLDTEEISSAIRHLIYVLGIGAAILRYFGTYYLSIKNNTKDTTYWGYLYFPSVFLSIAVFLWFKNRKYTYLKKSDKLVRVIRYLSSCSFGIYLMHYMVIDCIIRIWNIDISILEWRTIGIVIVYLISLVGVSIIKKIPIVSKILVP